MKVVIGRYDDPINHEQDDYFVDVSKNNLIIYGGVGSGKTTLLKTLITNIHFVLQEGEDLEIFILDFGNELFGISELPYVVGYFHAYDEENIHRALSEMDKKIRKPAKGRVLFVVDGLTSFFAQSSTEKYRGTFERIIREGMQKNITSVCTANTTRPDIQPYFSQKIALDIPSDKYSDVFEAKVEKPRVLSGRGIASSIKEPRNAYEFQGYNGSGASEDDIWSFVLQEPLHFDRNLVEPEVYSYWKRKQNDWRKSRNKLSIKTFDSAPLTEEAWLNYTQKPFRMDNKMIAGIDYATFKSVEVDLSAPGCIAFYGKKDSNKERLMTFVLEGMTRRLNKLFVLADGLKENDKTLFFEKYGEFELASIEVLSGRRHKSTETILVVIPSLALPKKSNQILLKILESVRDAEEMGILFVLLDARPFKPQNTYIPQSFATPTHDTLTHDEALYDTPNFVPQTYGETLNLNDYITHAFLAGDLFRFFSSSSYAPSNTTVFDALSNDFAVREEFVPALWDWDGFYLNCETEELIKIRYKEVSS